MPHWWSDVWPYLAALLPTICVAILFYFLIKAIIEGDRRERLAQNKWEAEHPAPGQDVKARRPADPKDLHS